MMEINVYNEEEFLAFMMIYAAHADGELAQVEELVILKRVGDDIYHKMNNIFHGLDEFGRFELIAAHRDHHLDSQEKKDYILNEMSKVFLSDDIFYTVEQHVLRMFDEII